MDIWRCGELLWFQVSQDPRSEESFGSYHVATSRLYLIHSSREPVFCGLADSRPPFIRVCQAILADDFRIQLPPGSVQSERGGLSIVQCVRQRSEFALKLGAADGRR